MPYIRRKDESSEFRIQSVETSKIADAIDIVDSLSATNSNYRHYVELKVIFTKKSIAPFTEREVAYYEDVTYAVSEVGTHYTTAIVIAEQEQKEENYLTNVAWFRYT